MSHGVVSSSLEGDGSPADGRVMSEELLSGRVIGLHVSKVSYTGAKPPENTR